MAAAPAARTMGGYPLRTERKRHLLFKLRPTRHGFSQERCEGADTRRAWQEDIMHHRPIWRATAIAASAATVLGGATLASAATGQPGHSGGSHRDGIQHVLLISVDGLHQQDLTWYVKNYPNSLLAALDRRGVEYSN